MPVLNFGKHRGKELADVPLSYLCWLLENVTLKPTLKSEILAEAERRLGEQVEGHLAKCLLLLAQGVSVFHRYGQSDQRADEWLDAAQWLVLSRPHGLRGKAT